MVGERWSSGRTRKGFWCLALLSSTGVQGSTAKDSGHPGGSFGVGTRKRRAYFASRLDMISRHGESATAAAGRENGSDLVLSRGTRTWRLGAEDDFEGETGGYGCQGALGGM